MAPAPLRCLKLGLRRDEHVPSLNHQARFLQCGLSLPPADPESATVGRDLQPPEPHSPFVCSWWGWWNEKRRHPEFFTRVFGHCRWENEIARHISPHFSLGVKWPSAIASSLFLQLTYQLTLSLGDLLFTPCLTISSQLKLPDTCAYSFGVSGHFVTGTPNF